MKKHVLFIGCFVLLFVLINVGAQVLSGVFFTAQYTPSIGEAWTESSTLTQEIPFYTAGNTVLFTVASVSISAIIAYVISIKMTHRFRKYKN